MILAGDIGGTKTRLALFDESNLCAPRVVETYVSRDHASLEEVVRAFVQAHPAAIELACFGVAGPVRHGRAETTNLPWIVDASVLRQQLGAKSAWLINDLEAYGYGVLVLRDDAVFVLNPGAADATGNVAVIAAGTGLGEAGIYWDGRRHHPFASEGGHANFAPSDELEVELLRWVHRQWPHASWERVLSGPGLVNIYRFLKDSGRGEEPPWLADELLQGDAAAVISGAALEQRSPLCVLALERFVRLYGSEAGNLALKVMSTGGLFVGGGIAPKIIAKLKDKTFMEAFSGKGRLRPVLEAIPVRVVLDQQTALLGAASCAVQRRDLGVDAQS